MWEGASPEALSQLLNEFEQSLIDHGMPPGSLNDGLSAGEVEARLDEVGLVANAELKVWFGWHDGEARPYALGSLRMSSLDQSLQRYQQNRARLEQSLTTELGYQSLTWGADEGWLRLERQNHAVTIECAKASGAPRLRYATEDFAFEPTLYRAVSLCTPVSNWLTAARAGAFKWNAETEVWDIDSELISTVRTRSPLG